MTDQTPPVKDELEAFGIANALIKARSELGMTQAQLAEVSGISRSAIKGYETGRNMPGSRELKALCRALKLSPNVMLFGTETPFDGSSLDGSESTGLRLFLTDPEDARKARTRLVSLAVLLSNDELSSLLNLINALAIARHGAEVVEQHIVGADMLAGMTGAFQKQTAKLVRDSSAEVDPDAMAADLHEFMGKQGHNRKKNE